MKKLGTICILLAIMSLSAGAASVNVRKFGARPDDGKDDTKALRKAAAYCRSHKGITLEIPAGVYILRDTAAMRLEEDVLAGKYGGNPEPKMFVPYFPYVKGMDFDGCQDVTINAQGAEILCEGWMQPVSITDCKNFTLNGLTIDYKVQPHSEGKVVDIEDEWFTVQFDDDRQMTRKMPASRLCVWDERYEIVYHKVYGFNKRELLEGNKMRFKGKIDPALLGFTLGMTHTYHFRPAVFIGTSDNTTLQDVTIHSQPGMGVLGWDSHDITLKGLQVVPRAGKRFSTNTDATHFASCSGLVKFEGCTFQGQGDDGTNVHGYYHDILSRSEDGWLLTTLDSPTFTHSQETDVPRIGDKIEVTEIATLRPVMVTEVIDVAWEPQSLQVSVKLKDRIPEDFSKYYLFNASKIADLEFRGCRILGNFARGVLSKARNVVIEDNYFQGTTGSAIHVGAESNWKEGSFAATALIRHNTIVNCAQSHGQLGGACGIAVLIGAPDTDGTHIHGDIRIEDNEIRSELYPSDTGISVFNASRLTIKGNKISGCQDTVKLMSVENVLID